MNSKAIPYKLSRKMNLKGISYVQGVIGCLVISLPSAMVIICCMFDQKSGFLFNCLQDALNRKLPTEIFMSQTSIKVREWERTSAQNINLSYTLLLIYTVYIYIAIIFFYIFFYNCKLDTKLCTLPSAFFEQQCK